MIKQEAFGGVEIYPLKGEMWIWAAGWEKNHRKQYF